MRRFLLACLLLLAVVTAASAGLFHRSGSVGPDLLSLQRVPFLGWEDWAGCGSSCTQTIYHTQSDALVSTGLTAAGYTMFQLTEAWSDGSRDGGGHLTTRLAAGVPAMMAYIKANGQHPILYTDSGGSGCGANAFSGPPGPTGHYLIDFTDFFVNWGAEGVEVDYCGSAALGLDPKATYGFGPCVTNPSTAAPGDGCIQDGTGVRSILNQVGVRLRFYNCADSSGGTGGQWEYNPYVCGHMRGAPDNDNDSACSTPGSMNWKMLVQHWQFSAQHAGMAMPYHFTDPDNLLFYPSWSAGEIRSLWAIWGVGANPVVLGCLVTDLTPTEIALVTDPTYISIIQDPWVRAAERVDPTQAHTYIAYSKRLQGNGNRAVALINYDDSVTQAAVITAAQMGIDPAQPYNVYDVASHTNLGSFTGSYTTAALTPHDGVLVKITGATEAPNTCFAADPGSNSDVAGTHCTFTADGYMLNDDGTQQNTAHAIDLTGVTDPAPQAVYQTWKTCLTALSQTIGQCPIEYRATNLQAGRNYKVRLHFSENAKTAAGQRRFVVRINTCDGSLLALTNFDIFAEAGAQYKAVVKEFTIPATCGMISVDLSSGAADFPAINGIEWIAQ